MAQHPTYTFAMKTYHGAIFKIFNSLPSKLLPKNCLQSVVREYDIFGLFQLPNHIVTQVTDHGSCTERDSNRVGRQVSNNNNNFRVNVIYYSGDLRS